MSNPFKIGEEQDYEWPCFKCGNLCKPIKLPVRVNIFGRVIQSRLHAMCDGCKADNLINAIFNSKEKP